MKKTNVETLNCIDTGGQKPVLFFIHGWPDSASLWCEQIAYFKENYRCVAVTLPGLGDTPPASLDFPELRNHLISKIEQVLIEAGQKDLILVGHDWGAYLTYMIEKVRPDLIKRFVTLDVGGHLKPQSLGHAFFILSYQWWLVAAYFIGKILPPIGNFMSALISKAGRAPRKANVRSQMNYLYFYFWRARLFKQYKTSQLGHYYPTKPILFLYGMKKKYPFHTTKWEKIVNETPGSRIVGLEGCDHWLMIRDAKRTNAEIDTFLTYR